MTEYIRSIPTEELLSWLQTDIMPWITAIITGVVMVTPMIATLISKLKAFVTTIQSAFDTVKNANDTNIEETQNAVQEIAKSVMGVFGEIQGAITALPIEEMKKVQVNSCEAIISFNELFRLSFQYLYEMSANMQGLSPEAKEKNKLLYDKAMSLIADKDLTASMKKLRELAEAQKTETVEEAEEETQETELVLEEAESEVQNGEVESKESAV